MNKPFRATTENGQPVVYDTVARVTYYGYSSMQTAIEHANELNHHNNELLDYGSDYFALIDYYNQLGEAKHA